MAEPKLVHDQFGQKMPIPKNKGKTIEFRKYDPLPVLTTPLTEGVTPNGQKLDVKTVTAEVKQYGGFIELSDIVLLTAIDHNLVQATKLLGSQAGRTLDTITREVLNGGTNVQYAEGQVESRSALVGGQESGNHYLTVNSVRMAVRTLKGQNAETINGSFVGIIHPDVAYDLMNDPKWVNVKTYSDPEGIYAGEIGKIENVRFVESTEAKIFKSAGSGSRDVYSTLIIGENAYGTTEISGGGLEHIVKQLGSAGAADPLNQRGSAGWKATKAAVRLVEPYMVRIETTASV
jgi:N4-gp56 family major capsid protein